MTLAKTLEKTLAKKLEKKCFDLQIIHIVLEILGFGSRLVFNTFLAVPFAAYVGFFISAAATLYIISAKDRSLLTKQPGQKLACFASWIDQQNWLSPEIPAQQAFDHHWLSTRPIETEAKSEYELELYQLWFFFVHALADYGIVVKPL